MDSADVFPATTDTGDPGAPDALAAAERLYDPTRLLDIRIEMDPADADALLHTDVDAFDLLVGEDCLAGPLSHDYPWYHAAITVDGRRVEDVGVRRKGLIGSLSDERPGLKVKMDKFVPGQTLDGIERLVLNAPVTDPTVVKQCLVYQAFREAGLPASRCNHARFELQGEDLGVYVNVEPVKKLFLRYAYDGDDDGHLYEGSASDFREGWMATFQPETSSTDPAMPALHAIREAVALPDDEAMLAALEEVLDLEAFTTHWALEALIGRPDGYTGHMNNYFVYVPEETGKAELLPWGADYAFESGISRAGADTRQVALAGASLPQRLWSIEAQRERYLAELRRLLAEAWDEAAMLAEIDRMAALIDPFALPDPDREAERDELRTFVAGRRAELEQKLLEELPELDEPLADADTACLIPAGDLTARFQTLWGPIDRDPLHTRYGTLVGTLHGSPIDARGGSVVGPLDDIPTLRVAADPGDGALELVSSIPPEAFVIGSTEIDPFRWPSLLYRTVDGVRVQEATLWELTVRFEVVDPRPGGLVRGEIVGGLYTGGPHVTF